MAKEKDAPTINDLKHPIYLASITNWLKYRLCYDSGFEFRHKYLKRFSKREDDLEFQERRDISYVPSFAKGAINEIKNSIFQRITDVTRSGGSKLYQDAVAGVGKGVDLRGSTMNAFIGRNVLPELLTMGRVGVYVDAPQIEDKTEAGTKGFTPYFYYYPTESIVGWKEDPDDPNAFQALLLQDAFYQYDQNWRLPIANINRYRYLWIDEDDGFVHVKFYDQDLNGIDYFGQNSEDNEYVLPINDIPFAVFELTDSLLKDAADYQIAMMNVTSSDLYYILKANYPFYVEQFDARTQSDYLKKPGNTVTTNQTVYNPISNTTLVNQERVQEIRVGTSSGRRYPIGTERPGFIHPSSEPISASMAKQQQMKEEIREIINLSLTAVQSKQAAPESRKIDNQGLEAGLSYIGLELEHGERKLARFWAMYEGSESVATINYPQDYSLITDDDRKAEADKLEALLPKIPSITGQKEIVKRIVYLIVGNHLSSEKLEDIYEEIDKAKVIVIDPNVIKTDLEQGLVSLDTASRARGYRPGEVDQAKEDHAERLKRIAISQTPDMGAARGVPDLGADSTAGSKEKAASRDTTQDGVVTDKTRGVGQNNE